MHRNKAIYILVCIGLLLSVALGAAESKADTLFQDHFASDLRYIPEMKARAADSIYLPENNETKIPDRDSLLALCAKVGYEAIADMMQRYYEEAIDAIPEDADRYEAVRRMRETVERIGGSILRRELEYGEAIALPDNTPEKRAKKVKAFYALADKSVARNDPSMEMRALIYILRRLYLHEQYYTAFLCAERIAKRLEVVGGDIDPAEEKNIWYDLGRLYFDFRDYEIAIPYLKAALQDTPVPRYYNLYNLQARNALGLYYRNIGELDTSDYYFRSMLECKDRVKLRPMFDCIALSNLASNYRQRGLYCEALALHAAALPFSLAEGDHSFTSGIYVGLADCYLETGKPDSCKAMIDSALYHIEQWPWVMSYRSCDLYPVMARYYTYTGEKEQSVAYMDSTTVANRRQDEKYSGLLVLRAKQELFESERALKEMQINTFRNVSVSMGVTAGVILIGLLVISVLYRKKHQAYRKLAACSREWAEQAPVVVPSAEADTADITLMDSLTRLIDEERIYLDTELDLESIAQRLGVHRNMISKAVNSVFGKPFSTYINECRIRQAICLLSNPANDHLSLETIAFDSGFSTRQTFYRAFKAQTGISPAAYRKNRG